ncbi:MAG: glutamate 5-kinase [Gammaproteobacteria bacterium]
MSDSREKLRASKRWVVKIGSALITDKGCGLKHERLNTWIAQVAELGKRGIEVVIVSSGAVAEGITRLGWKQRPTQVHQLQAAAAVGQMGLIQAYEVGFQKYGKHTAQILLTHEDVANRERYLNARTSINTLIGLGVIPVINENDSVATEEIRFGDNDTLAGMVANLIEADVLVLLTDQDGLYTADPNRDKNAELISEASVNDTKLDDYAGEGGALGRGGMRTKIKAARIAARSGSQTVIAPGNEQNVMLRIADAEAIGTLLTGTEETVNARRLWLAGQGKMNGSVSIDDGAVRALKENNKSLLPVGIKSVNGEFNRGEVIACLDMNGKEIARGLTNYNSSQARTIMGKSSQDIQALLGNLDEDEFIHRDNLLVN